MKTKRNNIISPLFKNIIVKQFFVWLFLCFFSQAWANDLNTTINTKLYPQLESVILNRPAESVMSVAAIYSNYKKISYRWIGQKNTKKNIQFIESNPLFAKTNIFNDSLLKTESDKKILFKRLKYTSRYNGYNHNLSGLILMPISSTPKGVILFFHSTINGKLNVPSMRFADYKSQMLAAVFAANGYIVIAPDYIGMGTDYKVAHPYILYPEINVSDARNMLFASMLYLRKNGFIQKQQKFNLYASGYSEGASYALWFSRIYQEQTKFRQAIVNTGLNLRTTVPIDGAYNLTGVMLPFLLTSQVNDVINRFSIITPWWGTLLKPSLLANVMLAYAHYNDYPIDKLLNSGFYNLQCIWPFAYSCNNDSTLIHNIETFLLSPLKNFSITLSYFFAAVFKSDLGIIYSPLFNSIAPLIPNDIIQDKKFMQTMEKANITEWRSQLPVTLLSLAQDSLVPEQNSSDAYNGMLKAGSKDLRYIKFNNQLITVNSLFGSSIVDHVSFELFALLIALKEFENDNKKQHQSVLP